MNEESDRIPLGLARVGDEGTLVLEGSVSVPQDIVQRLMSMGLVPGAVVRVKRVAPLGDPVMLEVSGYNVCVRRRESTTLSIDVPRPQRDGTVPGVPFSAEH